MMLRRLQDTMIFACQSVAKLAGSDDDTGNLLRKLAEILESVGNDENDPVPRELPSQHIDWQISRTHRGLKRRCAL